MCFSTGSSCPHKAADTLRVCGQCPPPPPRACLLPDSAPVPLFSQAHSLLPTGCLRAAAADVMSSRGGAGRVAWEARRRAAVAAVRSVTQWQRQGSNWPGSTGSVNAGLHGGGAPCRVGLHRHTPASPSVPSSGSLVPARAQSFDLVSAGESACVTGRAGVLFFSCCGWHAGVERKSALTRQGETGVGWPHC